MKPAEPIQIGQAIHQAALALSGAGADQPRLEAEWMVGHVAGKNRAELISRSREFLGRISQSRLEDMVRRRKNREPIQYLLGSQEFWGLEFQVGPEVLIPRPETEHLIEAVREQVIDTDAPLQAADLGTGSGCLAVTLARLYPGSQFFAVDLSEPSLEVARGNAKRHGVEKRIRFLRGNLTRALHTEVPERSLDFIISNPPYIPSGEIDGLQPEVSRFEPRIALDGGADGLAFFRRMVKETVCFLRPGGNLLLEIGKGQVEAVLEMARNTGWKVRRVINDLQGIPRTVVLERPTNH
ncbi:MAG TPA: peptide chain release factor N(5)-glutamine methyltransferase [Nitrospiria bacterium]|nr:peptide chain release factor N(5)-glutamine methyltransferase [Nitrospiria bacterium]